MRSTGPNLLRLGGEVRGIPSWFLGPQLFGLAAVVGGSHEWQSFESGLHHFLLTFD